MQHYWETNMVRALCAAIVSLLYPFCRMKHSNNIHRKYIDNMDVFSVDDVVDTIENLIPFMYLSV